MTLTALKIIALISMLIDHAIKILPSQSILMNLGMSMESSYWLLTGILPLGRIAFPIFAFCIAEGCIHTRNPKRYLLRLLAGAVVSEIPFQLAFFKEFHFGARNVFFTLLIGAAACMAYDLLCKRNLRWAGILVIPAAAVLAEALHTDYGGFGVLFIAVPYLFRGKYIRPLALAGLVSIFYFGYVTDWSAQYLFTLDTLLYWVGALAAVVLIWFYTGRPGKKMKWLFYVFYPAHIAILYGLSFLCPIHPELLP